MSLLTFAKTGNISSAATIKTNNESDYRRYSCSQTQITMLKCVLVVASVVCILLLSISARDARESKYVSKGFKNKLQVIKNIIFDDYGGRHGKILLGDDMLLFEVYASDNFGAIGVIHCDDVYCTNYTKHYIDSNNEDGFNFANQIYLRMSPLTKYPQILYSNCKAWIHSNQYKVKFITCHDVTCSKYTMQDLYNTEYNNDDDFSVYFIYGENNNPLISYNNNPNGGLQFIECINFDCSEISDNSPYTIDDRYSHSGWFNTIFNINEYLIFMYYNDDISALNYAFYSYIDGTLRFIKYGIFASDVHGAWFYTANIKDTVVAMVYVDYVTGNYFYGICDIDIEKFDIKCNQTIIDRHISDSPNDYELWDFPDIYFNEQFHPYPVTTYFDIDSFKMAECNNMQCDKNTFIETLSTGKYGYGRDTNMIWDNKQRIMYISFLDYDGNGNNKKARMVICSKKK